MDWVLGPIGAPLDVIRLKGVTARGHHGVLQTEKEEGQPFVADLALHLDTRAAAEADSLDATADYSAAARIAADVIAGEPAALIETVAARLADQLLKLDRVKAVDVTIHKPSAPLEVEFGDVSVSIHRSAPEPELTFVAPDSAMFEAVGEAERRAGLRDADAAHAADGVEDVEGVEDQPGGADAAERGPRARGRLVEARAAAALLDLDELTLDTGEHAAPGPRHAQERRRRGAAAPSSPAAGTVDRSPTEPVDAIVALGANLGEALSTLRSALDDLREEPGIEVVAVSPLARTAPVGRPDQPDFFNAVTHIRTTLSARALLHTLQGIEEKHGRQRTGRWAPRTLDLDLIAYETLLADEDELTIPHPRAHERAFVLVPWSLMSPKAFLPGLGGGSVAALAEAAPDKGCIRWLAPDWDRAPEPGAGAAAGVPEVGSDALPALAGPDGNGAGAPSAGAGIAVPDQESPVEQTGSFLPQPAGEPLADAVPGPDDSLERSGPAGADGAADALAVSPWLPGGAPDSGALAPYAPGPPSYQPTSGAWPNPYAPFPAPPGGAVPRQLGADRVSRPFEDQEVPRSLADQVVPPPLGRLARPAGSRRASAPKDGEGRPASGPRSRPVRAQSPAIPLPVRGAGRGAGAAPGEPEERPEENVPAPAAADAVSPVATETAPAAGPPRGARAGLPAAVIPAARPKPDSMTRPPEKAYGYTYEPVRGPKSAPPRPEGDSPPPGTLPEPLPPARPPGRTATSMPGVPSFFAAARRANQAGGSSVVVESGAGGEDKSQVSSAFTSLASFESFATGDDAPSLFGQLELAQVPHTARSSQRNEVEAPYPEPAPEGAFEPVLAAGTSMPSRHPKALPPPASPVLPEAYAVPPGETPEAAVPVPEAELAGAIRLAPGPAPEAGVAPEAPVPVPPVAGALGVPGVGGQPPAGMPGVGGQEPNAAPPMGDGSPPGAYGMAQSPAGMPAAMPGMGGQGPAAAPPMGEGYPVGAGGQGAAAFGAGEGYPAGVSAVGGQPPAGMPGLGGQPSAGGQGPMAAPAAGEGYPAGAAAIGGQGAAAPGMGESYPAGAAAMGGQPLAGMPGLGGQPPAGAA
ncbi:MAG: 2-amino-4-hydroxy-6-hydroxymethyldihydropteridine diphosphokinase, partial [Bifidobacteriaceae bacterium]|nr:2-amino-4-hydroxy-6-hydroxymethyldihydropteridine diphosphokinase [Bifidobacteriaceae bacterium]